MLEISEENHISMNEIDTLLETMSLKNKKVLNEFETYLQKSGITDKTISKDLNNIDFYINHYLLYDELISPEKGHDRLNDFFGYFFPQKAMWSSVNSVKANITSLKKFYKYLAELSLITDSDFKNMITIIKEEKNNWMSL